MSPSEWNTLVSAHPAPSGAFLQSWQWGQVEEACGRRVARVVVKSAAAQAVWVSLLFGRGYWYVARPSQHARGGSSQATAHALVQMLERQGRPSWVRWESFEPCGLQGRPADPLQCIATWVSDTTMSEEELFAGMHAKTRYNIRLAAKHDVVVEESRRLDAFLALMHQTAAHDGFHMHAASRYRAVLDCLDGKQGGPRAFLVEAHRGGAPLAMAVGVDWLGVRTYLYGASAWQEREHMAPYALHAWMLADARVRGIGRYDWWGISPSGAARHQLDGVTRFKRGFPGERIETKQPAIDMIFDGAVYGAYRFGRSVKGLLHL